MSLKFAALGTLTILSALGTSTRADEKELGGAQHFEQMWEMSQLKG